MSSTLDSDTSKPPQKWDLFSTGLKATVTVQWPVGCSFGDAQPNPEHQGQAVRGARMHAVSKDLPRLNSHLQQCCSCLGLLGWQGHPCLRVRGVPGPMSVLASSVKMMQDQDKVQKHTQPVLLPQEGNIAA